jgi:hypothetical protein
MAACFSPAHPTPRSTPPQGRRSPRPTMLAEGGRRSSRPRPELSARTWEAGPAGGGPRREEELTAAYRGVGKRMRMRASGKG